MKTCARCGAEHSRSHRYCAKCHADYMRVWRATHKLQGEALAKHNARSYARVYQKRGKLVQQPCEKCGAVDSQKHHEDYSRPLDVHWLCRPCHLAEHKEAA